MVLYDYRSYPEEKIEIPDNIVNILTLHERSGISLGCFIPKNNYRFTRALGVNYAYNDNPFKKGDRSPIVRGFQWENRLFEIKADEKLIVEQPERGQLFHDYDKLKIKGIFEGTLELFIKEFLDKGYELVKAD